jgi:hypothetical protein
MHFRALLGFSSDFSGGVLPNVFNLFLSHRNTCYKVMICLYVNKLCALQRKKKYTRFNRTLLLFTVSFYYLLSALTYIINVTIIIK